MNELFGRYFFVSDVHLGEVRDTSGDREKRFLKFLRTLPSDTRGLFLLGDIFDFWAEYRDVVPRGYVRVLGELARLADSGVKLWFFCGNHDWWVTDYLEKELGAQIVKAPYKIMDVGGLHLCIGHGDCVGRRSFRQRLLTHLFHSRFWIAVLKSIHPWFVFRLARRWSSSSRHRHPDGYRFRGEEEPIWKFADKMVRRKKVDACIFGHLHAALEADLSDGKKLYLLGDWGESSSFLNLFGMYISGFGLPKMEK